MSAAHTQRALALYRGLLRTARRFDYYNFRHYFLRRTRESFRANQKLDANDTNVTSLLADAEENLAVLRRQAAISQMYHFDKLVVERVK
ncbi:uncharacterized protein C5L36_0D01840 [Pichia kudriavzevii]|uniref:Protein ISD11 n=1 Tax=Pichia kudriavzevii TaxID=4909 RepID=A0A1V2LGK6_PICKU|nr:uncharacterized protein C5L36_0D01840 [Pichia kudriavzevii]AWU77446.1 hypothetical protein C5L36_0D01840 [Pichia kudriavzevii]ONH71217.1 Protein ISD11 [Pichia kudriavzevii]